MPLARRFGFSEVDVRSHFLRYNLGINSESNETYQIIGTQFALLVNYLPTATWFSKRLDAYAEFVSHYHRVLDIGFGIPFPWLIACSRGLHLSGHFTLLDSSQSALDFASEFINRATARHPERTAGLQYSLTLGWLEKPDEWAVGDIEAVVALDCVEHAIDPSACLARVVNRFRGATLLVGLPVGTPIPQHTVDFDNETEALAFVSTSGLKVIRNHLIRANWGADVVGNPGFAGSLFMEGV
jgi:hypothetical protein